MLCLYGFLRMLRAFHVIKVRKIPVDTDTERLRPSTCVTSEITNGHMKILDINQIYERILCRGYIFVACAIFEKTDKVHYSFM
jgi:hypothetical protein